MTLNIALCATNQSKNLTIGGDSELEHVKPVAEELVKLLNQVEGVKAYLIPTEPESKDSFSYQYLRLQQVRARELLSQLVGDKLCLNLHTDSGTTSHIGYYWRDEKGRQLGEEVANILKVAFNADTILNADYSDYIFATYPRPEVLALLLELGSHQNRKDYDYLNKNAHTVALLIRDAVLSFYHMNVGVDEEIDWEEITFYFKWGLERVSAHEDPRDKEAFALHCQRVGKLKSIRVYGFPCD
jgi:hypothetical protein